MKTKLLIIFASAGALIYTGASANDAKDKAGARADGHSEANVEQRGNLNESTRAELHANSSAGQQLQQASELIGADVRNQQDEKIGAIKDVMIDLQSGQVPFAVLSSGGFFGVGDRLLAVPLATFEQSSKQDELRMSMNREQLQSAPSFDANKWPDMNDQSWSSEVYSFYDAEPIENDVALNTSTTRTEINEPAGAESNWVRGRSDSESVSQYQHDSRHGRIPGHSDSTSQRFGETETGLSRDRTPRQGLGAEDLTKNEQKIYNPGGYAESDAFINESSGAERSAGTTTTIQEERRTRTDYNDSQGARKSMKSGKVTRASELIGMEVKNAQDERIGEIKDVVIDMQSGRVAYAVMDPDGSLAAGDKLFAVPPTVFTRGSDERWLIFNTDKEKLMMAPSFEKNDWARSNNQQFTTEVYRFYHQKPYWQSRREVNDPSGTEQYRYDRPDAQESQNDQGSLNQNQNQINEASGAEPAAPAAPATPATDPADSSNPATEPRSQEPERNETTLSPRAEEQKPDSSATKETAEIESATPQDQIQDPAGAAATSTSPATRDDQVTSDSDRRLNQQLRNTFQTDPALSASASKVQVSTVNGRITLRGSVATEEEKQAIASKAQELVGGAADKVDNQLQVGADANSPATPAPAPTP